MANRFPLIVDTSDSNKIKELQSGDNLQLSGNDIVGVVNITGSGTLTIESISATNITEGGTPLAAVATSGSYGDLSDIPTNVSAFTNDSNYVTSGSNVSVLTNDAGYLTTVSFDNLTSTPTTLNGYGITDAATSSQGDKADTALQPGSSISTLLNDAGYITLENIQNGDVTLDVNNTGDLVGSVFADDSTILVDGVLSAVNLDGTIRGNVVPYISEMYDLGSFDNRFKDAYINGQIKTTTIYSQDDADLTIVGASVDSASQGNSIIITGGANTSTGNGGDVTISGGTSADGVDGVVTITNAVVTGDLTGSVFADDSTLLVDGVAGKIVGPYDNGVVSINPTNVTTYDIFVQQDANTNDLYVANSIRGGSTGDIKNVRISSTAPTNSTGADGDQAGMIAFDSTYIYYCTAAYTDGVADIWKRVAWSGDTW
jgi:hypothetical protein